LIFQQGRSGLKIWPPRRCIGKFSRVETKDYMRKSGFDFADIGNRDGDFFLKE